MMTRIEKLRTASDEDIARQIIWATEHGNVFCKNRIDCEGDLLADREIPAERCAECMLEYLRKPCEGGDTNA